MAIGRLVARGVIGTVIMGHGLQKLTHSFGGHGLERTSQQFESLGLLPGRRHALAAGATETTGGAMLVLGYETPLATAALSGVMFTAIRTVHLRNGLWLANGGYEYNLVIIGALAALAETGPGPISLDALRGHERRGALWAVLTLGAGAVGSALAMADARRHAAQGDGASAEPTAEAAGGDAGAEREQRSGAAQQPSVGGPA